MKIDGVEIDQYYSGNWVRPVMKGFLHACCDCGEVSSMEFRVVKHRGKEDAVEFRMYRHDAKTDQARQDPSTIEKIARTIQGVLDSYTGKLREKSIKPKPFTGLYFRRQCDCLACKRTRARDSKHRAAYNPLWDAEGLERPQGRPNPVQRSLGPYTLS